MKPGGMTGQATGTIVARLKANNQTPAFKPGFDC